MSKYVNKISILSAVFLAFFSLSVRADDAVIASSNWKLIKIFEDTTGELDVTGVYQQLDRFEYLTQMPSYGSTDSHLWFYLSKEEVPLESEIWLEFDNPVIDHVNSFFVQHESSNTRIITATQTGDMQPFDSRAVSYRSYIFPIDFSTVDGFLLEVYGETPLLVPFSMGSPVSLMEDLSLKENFILFLYGIIFSMTVYNLVFYIGTRYSQYGWYAIYMVSLSCSLVFSSGFGYAYIWEDNTWLQNNIGYFFYSLFLWGAFNFSRSYLNTAANFPAIDRWYRWFAQLPLLLVFIQLIYLPALIGLITIFMVLLAVIVPALGILSWRKKIEGSLLFLLSWSIMLTGMVMFNLTVVGAIEGYFYRIHAAEIGVAIESVLLSFALMYRIRRVEETASKREKSAHEEVRRALRLVKQSNAAKDSFMLSAGHQLKTPIHILMGNLQLLSEELSDEKSLPLVEQSDRSATELLFKIDNLLTYSQIVSKDLRPLEQKINIRTEFLRMQHQWKHLYENPLIHFDLDFEPKIPMRLEMDWVHVRKIIRIALENAVDAEDSGRIYIKLMLDQVDEQSWLTCTVQDQGSGVSNEVIQWFNNEFDDGRWDGASLGLFLSKTLTKQVHGHASLENLPGNGAIFRVSCPVKCLEEVVDYRDDSVKGKKILVVDDMDVNLKLMKSMLKKLNTEVAVVNSGYAAIKELEKHAYDLVLMDCQMPELTGQETTEKIRQNDLIPDSLTIIAVSANDSDLDRESCLYAGMNDFLAKPVRLQSLDQKLKEWLSGQ